MSLISFKNTLHSWYKSGVEQFTTVSDESEFNEKGVLTPEEFLKAGIQLVHNCPTWNWESGDINKRWHFLPDKQQYLITRSVPCLKRVSSLQMDQKEEMVEGGEWLSAFSDHKTKQNTTITEIEDDELIEMSGDESENENESNNTNSNKSNDKTENTLNSINDISNNNSNNNNTGFQLNISDTYIQSNDNTNANVNTNNTNSTNIDNIETNEESSDGFEEIQDIETYWDEDNVVPEKPKTNTKTENETNNKTNNENESKTNETNVFKLEQEELQGIVRSRTYDISITYDKFYRVPHVWLSGYDENNKPLTSAQIMEDISSDHANKTVTIEKHPHTGLICVSIHPCRHSEVMKRFMDRMNEKLKVEQYMFLFLKFLSAVIPTIEYDFTVNVTN